MEKVVKMENLDLMAHLAHLAKEVYLECPDSQDQKVIEGSQDWTVLRVHKDPLGRREKVEVPDRWVHQDQWEVLDREENAEEKAHLDPQG